MSNYLSSSCRALWFGCLKSCTSLAAVSPLPNALLSILHITTQPPEGLDLVEEDEQITHQIQLDEELDVQDSLSKRTLFSSLFRLLDCEELTSFADRYLQV